MKLYISNSHTTYLIYIYFWLVYRYILIYNVGIIETRRICKMFKLIVNIKLIEKHYYNFN